MTPSDHNLTGANEHPTDREYLKIVLDAIGVCYRYKPKFGQRSGGGGLTLDEFQALYREDPFYAWFGLDNEMMYAAHKAAGGMTSIYRQIGIGCEQLFRQIARDMLGLSEDDVAWSYQVTSDTGSARTLRLDGRVPLKSIEDDAARDRFHGWMADSARVLDVDEGVLRSLTGTVFEVRQGYKSRDSKRQHADIANAATAYTKGYLPCVVLLSGQIDATVLARYRAEKWSVISGARNAAGPLDSTYDFMRDVVGYDLAAFFERHCSTLRREVDVTLRSLLSPGA